jgi:glutamyl-tRNA synthetase
MENGKIRLRFAPSPTGFLHIGNLRTALFGYLLAKSYGGKFILRIEDTDQKREVENAAEKLVDILSWIGINFDEGVHLGGPFAPYKQSERLEIYEKYSQELLDKGLAYRCFCTEERLEEMRNKQITAKQPPRYDRLCRNLSSEESERRAKNGETFVIRQKMLESGEIVVHDELRGDIRFRAEELDDHVLIKSNGVPTYHFANIVDDHLMEISHVTRGDEWLPSFPKNILLYQAFGWMPPKFIHLPLILNKTGGKLSKRQGDVFVEQYKDKGYLAAAIVNFCVLLGWHSKDDQEIWSLTDLEKSFSLDGMGSSPAIFDPEKLDYYNSYYIRQLSLESLVELVKPFADPENKIEAERFKNFISLAQDRLKRLDESREAIAFLEERPEFSEELLSWKSLSVAEAKDNLKKIRKELVSFEPENWNKENLEKRLIAWVAKNGGKNGDYLWPLRVALSGLKNSPSPFEIAWAIGKEESLRRIDSLIS